MPDIRDRMIHWASMRNGRHIWYGEDSSSGYYLENDSRQSAFAGAVGWYMNTMTHDRSYKIIFWLDSDMLRASTEGLYRILGARTPPSIAFTADGRCLGPGTEVEAHMWASIAYRWPDATWVMETLRLATPDELPTRFFRESRALGLMNHQVIGPVGRLP